ncbi:NleF caspase inhibitor [Escherichia albertii]|uniref:NleF caspase inhibitor n=1 Tax=Escherichia albertii TaxID=208962 RepID=A0AAX3MFK0_ESCAL|nr:NleF caspase inhibitor [Escherichia albertii]EFO1261773.1 type III effector [Escherichia albertii]MCQ8915296.1 type III effector [Escherichia albertii]MCQ8926069.1 type III effector [Escherichia albertii]MCQ8942541.1 type III effector [Escherichia albertii]MCQ8949235.1 type III effector [Escherichia albertii]
MGCLTAHCSCATNTSEREDLYPPIKDLVDALMAQRAEVFEVQNEGTDNVKGALREGKTTDDRDCYVRDLLLLYTLKTGMDDVRTEKGLAPCKVDDLLEPHHSTEFAGDLKALKCLVEGRSDDYAPGEPVQVPDLTYNKGSMQFG